MLVIACHLFPASPLPGWLGVDVFFVLSGYLITSLLITDRHLVGFYFRRIARLYPALLVTVLVVAPVAVAVKMGVYHDGMVAAGYAANYSQASHGHIGAFSHMWSLAVEEQFYLVWPLVMLAMPFLGRRAVAMLALGGCFITWALLVTGYKPWTFETWSYRTEIRGGGLLLGCALALFAPTVARWVGSLGVGVIAVTLLAGAALHQAHPEFYIPAVVVGSAFIIANPPGWFAHPQLVRLGKVSYSLYLWHYPALYLLHAQPLPVRLAGLTLAAGVSVACYRMVELPVRQWARQHSWAPRFRTKPLSIGSEA